MWYVTWNDGNKSCKRSFADKQSAEILYDRLFHSTIMTIRNVKLYADHSY